MYAAVVRPLPRDEPHTSATPPKKWLTNGLGAGQSHNLPETRKTIEAQPLTPHNLDLEEEEERYRYTYICPLKWALLYFVA